MRKIQLDNVELSAHSVKDIYDRTKHEVAKLKRAKKRGVINKEDSIILYKSEIIEELLKKFLKKAWS